MTFPTVKLDLWPTSLRATPEAIRAALFGTLPKSRGYLVVLDRNNGEALQAHCLGKRYALKRLIYSRPDHIITQAELAVSPEYHGNAQHALFRFLMLPRKDNSFLLDQAEKLLLAFVDRATANIPHKWVPTR